MRRALLFLLCGITLTACPSTAKDTAFDSDLDDDGFATPEDCDDSDAAVHPGAEERWYDGVDADCAGDSDFDADEDGYDLTTYGGDDCDDDDVYINPAAFETWYDGVDQDCSGGSDYDADSDGLDSIDYGGTDCVDTDSNVRPGVQEIWYDGVDQDCSGDSDFDADTDSYDSTDWGGLDCNDLNAAVNPGATETWYDSIDQNCDGLDDFDADGDGHAPTRWGGDDCDDSQAAVYWKAPETCDGLDNNCNSTIDEGFEGQFVTSFRDADLDGYGDSRTTFSACANPPGYVMDSTDCNDADPTTYPGAAEDISDGVDNDCDGDVDENMPSDGPFLISWAYLYNSKGTYGEDYVQFSATGTLSNQASSMVGTMLWDYLDAKMVSVCQVVLEYDAIYDMGVRVTEPQAVAGWSDTFTVTIDTCNSPSWVGQVGDFSFAILNSQSAFSDMESDYKIPAQDNADGETLLVTKYGWTAAGYFCYFLGNGFSQPLGYWFYP